MRTTWGLTTIMSPLALPLTEAHIPWAVLALQMKEREIVENSTIAIYMIDCCIFFLERLVSRRRGECNG
jgi:hypothetical protein